MNGHEEGAETASGSGVARQQGIFSTEELTVETENIPKELGGTAENSQVRERAVSGLRRERRFRNSSRALDEEISSGELTGDILVGSGPQSKQTKKNFPKLFIIVVIAAITVVGGMGILVSTISKKTATVESSYADLVSLMNNSPDDVYQYQRSDEEEERFFLVASQYLSLGEPLKKYYTDLDKRLDAFIAIVDKKGHGELKSSVDRFSLIFKVLETYALLPQYDEELSDLFRTGDTSRADSYITSLKLDETGDKWTDELAMEISTYLENRLAIYDIYKQHNCFKNDVFDSLCAADVFDRTLTIKLNRENTLISEMQTNFELGQMVFDRYVELLNKEIGQ